MRAFTVLLLCGCLFTSEILAQSTRPGVNSDPDKSGSNKDTPSSVGGKRLEEWKQELANEDASKRAQAILAIMQFGDEAASCVPALIERLQDRDVSPRARALLALRTIAIQEKDVDAIVKAIGQRLLPQQETQAVIRYEATISLRRYIDDGQPAIPSLITATMDKSSWEIRNNAVSLLWRIGIAMGKEGSPPDARIVEALLAALRFEKTYQVKLEIIQGIGALGRPTNPALLSKVISELTLCAGHKNRPLAIWAYAGLVALQDATAGEQSLNTLSKFLRNENLETRIQATLAIGTLGEKAKKKLPNILAMLKDKEPYAVKAAAAALGSIGDKSPDTISALVELLDEKDPDVAGAAVASLVNLKQNNSTVLTAFDRLLGKKDLDLRLRSMIQEGTKELKKPAKK